MQRGFTAIAPNKKWGADLSYIPLRARFIYLSFILDLYARKVVGWALAAHMTMLLWKVFFGSLKAELFSKGEKINTMEKATRIIFEYIEVYYNRKRLPSTLGYMSPVEWEEKQNWLI